MKKRKFLLCAFSLAFAMIMSVFTVGCAVSDEIDKWRCGHKNTTIITIFDSTCIEKGEENITCHDCGKTWTEQTPKSDHAWDEGIFTDSNCTEDSFCIFTCTVCGEIKDVVYTSTAKGHVERVLPAVSPTCSKEGVTEGKDCAICGAIFVKQQKIPKLEHTFRQTEAKAPTCFEDGYTASVSCISCGLVVAEKVVLPREHIDNDVDGICDSCTIKIPTYVRAEVGEYVLGNTYRIYFFDGNEPTVLKLSGEDCYFCFDGSKTYIRSAYFESRLFCLENFDVTYGDNYMEFTINRGIYKVVYEDGSRPSDEFQETFVISDDTFIQFISSANVYRLAN